MRKLTHQEILARQRESAGQSVLPFVVVLDNIRSLHNVGSIFRTADGIGIEKIYLTGITGHPPSNQISKIALDAEETVNWEYVQDIKNVVQDLKQKGYKVVCLEQIDQSVSYSEVDYDQKTCLIIGNEIDGISESVVPYCDLAIDIPMNGLKNSLNVSVAFGVVAYHISEKIKKKKITLAGC